MWLLGGSGWGMDKTQGGWKEGQDGVVQHRCAEDVSEIRDLTKCFVAQGRNGVEGPWVKEAPVSLVKTWVPEGSPG